MQRARIEVWKIPLDIADDVSSAFAAGLDDVERERAGRFRFPLHRRRFVARRAVMRLILGRYLGIRASEVRYDLADHGKPMLSRRTLDLAERTNAGAPDPEAFRFNLSHSHELALLAIGTDHDLGIDIEKHVGRRADRGVAERFFTDKEVSALEALAGPRYIEGFFKCWTSKEAFVKALGCGLSVDLGRFEVCVSPDTPAALRWADPTLTDSGDWSLARFEPAEGYSGALAMRACDYEITQRYFDTASITEAELATLTR